MGFKGSLNFSTITGDYFSREFPLFLHGIKVMEPVMQFIQTNINPNINNPQIFLKWTDINCTQRVCVCIYRVVPSSPPVPDQLMLTLAVWCSPVRNFSQHAAGKTWPNSNGGSRSFLHPLQRRRRRRAASGLREALGPELRIWTGPVRRRVRETDSFHFFLFSSFLTCWSAAVWSLGSLCIF